MHPPNPEQIRVVVTGAESTGKTTLAMTLGESFGAPVVPEVLRMWVDRVGRLPLEKDLSEIASEFIRADERARATDQSLVVYDTDLATLSIYWDYYFGSSPTWLYEEMLVRRPRLYLLAGDDIAWTADAQRDSPAVRAALQASFESVIPSLAPTVRVTGNQEDREEIARIAIAEVLANG